MFIASDMVLRVDLDVVYLVKLSAKSCMAGFYYVSSKSRKFSDRQKPPLNRIIHIVCKTIPHVMVLAAESE